MFNNFPYTNMHELNLDWIIEAIQLLKVEKVSFSGRTDPIGKIESDIPSSAIIYLATAGTGQTVVVSNNGTTYDFYVKDSAYLAFRGDEDVTVTAIVHYEEEDS